MNNRVIMVDDDEKGLFAMKTALSICGFPDVGAYTAWCDAEADVCRSAGGVLILDIVMPGISGVDILQILADRRCRVQAIMLTGVNDVREAVRCMKLGARDYLVKPVSGELLAEAIRRAIGDGAAEDGHEPSGPSGGGVRGASDIRSYHPDTISVPSSASGRDRQLAEALLKLIAQKPVYTDTSLTLADCARRLDTNTAYLSRCVNTVFGMSFPVLLSRVRLAVFTEKRSAAANSRYSIEGLAAMCGFASYSGFYGAFRAFFGVTPAEWQPGKTSIHT